MNAIVLARRDFREHDQRISCFTKEQGRMDLFARGVKKITSKNGAALEPFSFVYIGVAAGKDLQYITSVQLQEYFRPLRQDPLKSLYAGFLMNRIERWMLPHEQDEGVFMVLLHALQSLADMPEPGTAYLDIVISRVLVHLGFTPELSACIVCEKPAHGATRYQFDMTQGGVVCQSCHQQRENSHVLSAEDILLWQEMLASESYVISSSDTVHRLILAFTEFHTERGVPDWGKLEKVLE